MRRGAAVKMLKSAVSIYFLSFPALLAGGETGGGITFLKKENLVRFG